ncbi:MAG: hypothetical protein QOH99_1466 [Frankiaceae bacterium]|nr:hypothetical protein [Frankiaceae bacterium]
MTDPAPPVAVDPPPGGPTASGVWAAVLVLFLLGIVLATLGVLLVPLRLHILGRALPVAWVAALVNFTAGRLAQGALERWWAPAVPFLGWALVVGPMTVFTPGGDKIFAYDDPSLLYVALGVLAFMGTVGTAATPARQTSR